MIDQGNGPLVVLIPGIHGRFEWMMPTVDALATHFRVVTGSLPGEPGSVVEASAGQGFEAQAAVVERLLERAGATHATLVGVSFGGLVAAYVAATRPERVDALVLASAPGPDWEPDAKAKRYLRSPRLMSPVFVLGAPWRLGPEILAARRTTRERVSFLLQQGARVLQAPIRPGLMGERLRQMAAVKAADWCPKIAAPTLVLTGEPPLDRVVPVEGTRRFATAIRNATIRTLPGTGHIGSITRPDVFADAVWEFVSGLESQA